MGRNVREFGLIDLLGFLIEILEISTKMLTISTESLDFFRMDFFSNFSRKCHRSLAHILSKKRPISKKHSFHVHNCSKTRTFPQKHKALMSFFPHFQLFCQYLIRNLNYVETTLYYGPKKSIFRMPFS